MYEDNITWLYYVTRNGAIARADKVRGVWWAPSTLQHYAQVDADSQMAAVREGGKNHLFYFSNNKVKHIIDLQTQKTKGN